jgi:hypothetical protein
MGYELGENTNLLQAMYSDKTLTSGSFGWITFLYILFPILTYITSIPVAMIVVRLNFLAARICSRDAANWWAVWLPFIVAIPFQTGNFVTYFGTYTSIIFQSTCNFFTPFLIFLFLSRRNIGKIWPLTVEMAQSVLDELEFLDINAGIKKGFLDDDDFDYIYHLPTADPDRIIYRDPFKEVGLPSKKKNKKVYESLSQLSVNSRHSIKEIRGMLDPSLGLGKLKKMGTIRRRETSNKKILDQINSDNPVDGFQRMNSVRKSEALGRLRGAAVASPPDFPIFEDKESEKNFGFNDIGADDNELNLITVADGGGALFRAMPDFVYRFVNPKYIAATGLIIMVAMVLQVVLSLWVLK